MPQPYSQSRALWAITRASFKAIFNQPTAVFFSLLFPIIFILIFGAFGNSRGPSYRVAISQTSDTTNPVYMWLRTNPIMRLVPFTDSASIKKELTSGRLSAVLDIKKQRDTAGKDHYMVDVSSTTASGNTLPGLMQVLEYLKLSMEVKDIKSRGLSNELVSVNQPRVEEVRKYRQIDFILPGQLGFSILFSTLFGVAFTFYTLREQLVLKRFYASPVNKVNILLGIGMSRLFFQLINVVVLILFGHYLLNFTLQHGVLTFIEMLVMTILMLFLLMGVGLIFSSIVKSDASIPLLINLFGFPQMLLSGTFFPIEVFPKWLQEICRLLPLTQFNDAIRKISFEGQHLVDCWKEISYLGIWIAVIYIILARVIKWQ